MRVGHGQIGDRLDQVADGSVLPLAQTTAITGLLVLIAGATPFYMARRRA
jgi:hypothetical protein